MGWIPGADGCVPWPDHRDGGTCRLVKKAARPVGPGGPHPGERLIPGTVTLTAAGRRRVAVRVAPRGFFGAAPARPVRVSARSPGTAEGAGRKWRVRSPRRWPSPSGMPPSWRITAVLLW